MKFEYFLFQTAYCEEMSKWRGKGKLIISEGSRGG